MATYKHDHTHITTPEPEKLIEFYTKVMGAKVINEIEAAGNEAQAEGRTDSSELFAQQEIHYGKGFNS